MLHVFVSDGGTVRWARGADTGPEPLPDGAVWLDLLNPTPDEVARTEALLGLRLPTREQLAEIEESSRLRQVSGALHATVPALVWTDTDTPRLAPVAFVLAGRRLVTLHHIDPQAFLTLRRRASRSGLPDADAASVLGLLIDGILERTATVLRRTAADLDLLGRDAFRRTGPAADAGAMLKRLGQAGHLFAKAHESLSALERLLDLLARGEAPVGKKTRRWARGARMDAFGLDEYAHFLSGKVKLLLDTSLGQIGAQQTEIIKIVSVLSVALFPPTLVASIYGMNFPDFPGEHEVWGYPLALLTMVLSAVVPLTVFRWRGWL
ncbi:CorA family divalent cation transporter [Azospirillum halopraeferens]|uniref:CorA family divalent cation transporter n=1 Tax=Azospirillum halopraeferens TaxID=34010 RepID=UPI000414AA4D|nr:CorA family divalent cation transporter [Azospirillum halopraeferens]